MQESRVVFLQELVKDGTDRLVDVFGLDYPRDSFPFERIHES